MPINFYLPNIPVALCFPKRKLADNQILLRVPRFMTKIDIRNYMKSMYGLENILKVNTFVERRVSEKHPLPKIFSSRPYKQIPFVWKTMMKRAIVTLQEKYSVPTMKELGGSAEELVEKKQNTIKERLEVRNKYHKDFHQVLEERYPDPQNKKIPVEEVMKFASEDFQVQTVEPIKLHPLALVKGTAKKRLDGTFKYSRKLKKGKKWINK